MIIPILHHLYLIKPFNGHVVSFAVDGAFNTFNTFHAFQIFQAFQPWASEAMATSF